MWGIFLFFSKRKAMKKHIQSQILRSNEDLTLEDILNYSKSSSPVKMVSKNSQSSFYPTRSSSTTGQLVHDVPCIPWFKGLENNYENFSSKNHQKIYQIWSNKLQLVILTYMNSRKCTAGKVSSKVLLFHYLRIRVFTNTTCI